MAPEIVVKINAPVNVVPFNFCLLSINWYQSCLPGNSDVVFGDQSNSSCFNIQAKVRTHSTEIASLKRGERTSQTRTDELTTQIRLHPEPNNTPYGKLIRIEFPKFSCDDVKDWVYRCKQFFKVDGVPDERKIQLASMHMFDVALVWYQQYVKKYPDNTPWEHFEVEVVTRFGVLYDDPIVELKNLKQTGSVQTYQEAFEALLNIVDLPNLVAVKTYGLARMQEATNTILKPRYNTYLLSTPEQFTTTYVSKAVTTPVKSNSVGQSSRYVTRNGAHKPYRLTQRKLEDKRAKGQCFYCDQKYAPCHKCSGQLHSIKVICGDDFDNHIDGDDETYQDCVGDMGGVTDSPQITLKALSGLNSYQTMRVRGRVGKELVLRGMKNTHVHWMQGNEGMLKQAELSFIALCVYPVQLCQMESVGSVSAEMEQVLTKFDEVFEVLKDLPP
uniref:Retrotransposon gag domain-containing protein n=1 Tax=Tanacetum cinerariifolium TaxID=118510 RepID=A0A6L2N413_TANCI|nr:hypothetical protein [Tanacetum cinerariifolium]